MKLKSLLFLLALFFSGAAVSLAQNPHMGTWKLNEAKSHMPAGLQKNQRVVYEDVPDGVQVTTDGVDRHGKDIHTVWTGHFDGKDYPLLGDPFADTRAYTITGPRSMKMTNKDHGNTVAEVTIDVAPGGRSRVVTSTSTSPSGQQVTGTSFYDKKD